MAQKDDSKNAGAAKSAPAAKSQPAAPAAHGKPGVAQKQSKLSQKQHSADYRGIVRLVGKDLEGYWPLERALYRVKGIGQNLAHNLAFAIERELKISPKTDVGELSEEQLLAVESIIKSPGDHGIRDYNLNRQADPFDGKDKHLLASDLSFAHKQDVQQEIEMKSYKGWRFQLGQRVRGQHSRTTGRTGISVGVLKKALKQQKAAAPAAAAPAEKKK